MIALFHLFGLLSIIVKKILEKFIVQDLDFLVGFLLVVLTLSSFPLFILILSPFLPSKVFSSPTPINFSSEPSSQLSTSQNNNDGDFLHQVGNTIEDLKPSFFDKDHRRDFYHPQCMSKWINTPEYQDIPDQIKSIFEPHAQKDLYKYSANAFSAVKD